MKYLMKPLTEKMLAQLKRARAIELSDSERNICLTDDFRGSLSGLYKRGFVDTEMAFLEGKEILKIFITKAGINFLDRYDDEKI